MPARIGEIGLWCGLAAATATIAYDIVQVLQQAKYLTGQPATWEEGDWTGDGVFDQFDIVAALQTDDYLRGPRT